RSAGVARRDDEGGLGHERERLPTEERAVVVGLLGEHHLDEAALRDLPCLELLVRRALLGLAQGFLRNSTYAPLVPCVTASHRSPSGSAKTDSPSTSSPGRSAASMTVPPVE